MRRKTLAYVKTVRSRGHVYHYFDTGEKADGKPVYKRLPDKMDPTFGRVYAAMLGHRTRRGSNVLTVIDFVAKYQASKHFNSLSDATQRLYKTYQGRLVEMLPSAPAGEVEPSDIMTLFEKMSLTPGAANMMLASVGALYKWGRSSSARLVTNTPTADIDLNEIGEHDPWPRELLDAALKSKDDTIRLAVHLLYYTAQRIGDVVAMRWSDVEGDIFRPKKTGKDMVIAVHTDLAHELVSRPRDLRPILLDRNGKTFTRERLRKLLQKWAKERGHNIVPHGLRKNAVIALLEAGCTTVETAAVSGQSLRMVEHYARARDQKKLAQSAVLKWPGTVRESSNIRKTTPTKG